jgi:signal transduction histidine kinase
MSKFKTRARAVDMLGRQQIAGVPNAISELFKNAHDAYAKHVEVDYFRSDGLFVLRDDGLGMTLDDFENRWLIIGTESKLGSGKGIDPPPKDPNQDERPITGEKGIGRLAIAVVGPQVLVLTRAKRDNKLHDLVVAFIHWGLFEAPGVNLEQIDIPVLTFPGGTLPSKNETQQMVEGVRQNVDDLEKGGFLKKDFAQKLMSDLKRFDIDLIELSKILGTPSLLDDGYGTHFYILPTTENLAPELDAELDLKAKVTEYSRLRKLLLGFTNTMIGGEKSPISTSFRYWPTDDKSEEMIATRDFFTPDDFQLVDHFVTGDFDEFGQFVGTVTIYGKENISHVIPWQKGTSKATSCGPFSIRFGYVQGRATESKVPPELYAQIMRKLDLIGGLYIYQDNIRILPYGDFDVDFLGMEKRRSKSAGDYFFSYRRIFGAIGLNRKNNVNLVEKAGREGFQDNKAYREFKSILENFFIQLAADFFRDNARYSDIWGKTKEELLRFEAARKRQDEESKKKRREFEKTLDIFFERINTGTPQREAGSVIENLKSMIDSAAQKNDELALLDAEMFANRSLKALRDKYKVELPQGIGLGSTKRDWSAYTLENQRLEQVVFNPIQIQIETIVSSANKELHFALDRKKRIDLLIDELLRNARATTQDNVRATQDALASLQNRFRQLIQQVSDDLTTTSEKIEAELMALDITSMSENDLEKYRHKWESRISLGAQRNKDVLTHVKTQLENINWSSDENGYLIGSAEITAALEDEVLALREQADANLELTQLGMAVDIINHEFSNTIKAIRNNLGTFKGWADVNPELQIVYNNINDSFTHLDGYLTLFTPLNRRRYRNEIEIHGSNIAKYIEELFSERLIRHSIDIKPTNAFRNMTILGYPSTFYPVFINLIDNAIFWLKDRPLPREVKLDAKGKAFIVSDNGPGIPLRDREAIFELGFTRKPGGRGMGLYISQEVLKKVNYQLLLSDKKPDNGAAFIIKPIDE